MILNSIGLVGSILVPLAALVTFAIFYFRKFRKYLLEKNSYADCQFLEDICKGYTSAKIAHAKILRSKFWWYFFGSRYIDLLNFYCQSFIYELDKLEYFEDSRENSPVFRRHSFMSQWKNIHSFIFETSYGDRAWNEKAAPYKICEEYGDDPFGWMSVVMAGKLFELYKKHALYLLRTKGYVEFSNFLSKYYGKSQRYPHNIPFSAIHRDEFHVKIVYESSLEVAERLRSELKNLLNQKKRTKPLVESLRDLVDTFILSDKKGYHYPGLSDVRKEIYALIENEKVVN